jgi:hypothetical protein
MTFPALTVRKVIYRFGITILLAIASVFALALCAARSDPPRVDRVYVSVITALHANDPTPKLAYEGYGDTCVQQYWYYPAKYAGVQDWIDNEPTKAAPASTVAIPGNDACEKNLNPSDPSKPLTGKDYGPDYGPRFIDQFIGQQA